MICVGDLGYDIPGRGGGGALLRLSYYTNNNATGLIHRSYYLYPYFLSISKVCSERYVLKALALFSPNTRKMCGDISSYQIQNFRSCNSSLTDRQAPFHGNFVEIFSSKFQQLWTAILESHEHFLQGLKPGVESTGVESCQLYHSAARTPWMDRQGRTCLFETRTLVLFVSNVCYCSGFKTLFT